MKKKISIILLVLLLAMGMISSANAAVIDNSNGLFASQYIIKFSSTITSLGNGKLEIAFDVGAQESMNMLGVKTIILQEKDKDNNWVAVKTYSYANYPNMMAYNKSTMNNSVPYSGDSGSYYRAKVYFYAEKGGYDTKEFITSEVKAK